MPPEPFMVSKRVIYAEEPEQFGESFPDFFAHLFLSVQEPGHTLSMVVRHFIRAPLSQHSAKFLVPREAQVHARETERQRAPLNLVGGILEVHAEFVGATNSLHREPEPHTGRLTPKVGLHIQTNRHPPALANCSHEQLKLPVTSWRGTIRPRKRRIINQVLQVGIGGRRKLIKDHGYFLDIPQCH